MSQVIARPSNTWARGLMLVGLALCVPLRCGTVAPPLLGYDVDVLVYGAGRVDRDPAELRYLAGSELVLVAVDKDGESFSLWGADAAGSDPILRLRVNRDLTIVSLFEGTPRRSSSFTDPVIFAADGTFLGVVNDNPFLSESVANPLGAYGDHTSGTSIWNPFGRYGSSFGDSSAYSDSATTPPIMVSDGAFFAFVTTNTAFAPRVDPDEVAIQSGRPEQVRP